MAKARLRRGIELVKLTNRIEQLRMQEDETDGTLGQADVPLDAQAAASSAFTAAGAPEIEPPKEKKSLSKIAKGAIFREVVLAKVREMKEQEDAAKMEKEATEKNKKK